MTQTVLLADDSVMMRRIIAKELKEMPGFDLEIFEAGNGIEATELLAERSIDILFLDWNMPKRSGLEVVKIVRAGSEGIQANKEVPIIMITTEGSVEKIKEAIIAGATDYLAKPFDPEVFQKKIKPYLRNR